MVGAQDSVLNRITGMVLHFPGGAELRLDGKETKAVVVDRYKFDQRCKERAVAAGARYVTGSKFLDFRGEGRMAGNMDRGPRRYPTAGCWWGPTVISPAVSKMAGLPPPRDSVKGSNAISITGWRNRATSTSTWATRSPPASLPGRSLR